MKKLLFVIYTLFISFFVFSQDYSDKQNMDVNYNREASFEGGLQKLLVEILNNMEYSQSAIEKKIEGEIMVSFNIYPDSSARDVSIIAGVDDEIDKDIENIILNLKYIPALAEGNPVKQNIILNIPIRVGVRSKLKSDISSD
jgi:outer membrane biosynthesis protein TonB